VGDLVFEIGSSIQTASAKTLRDSIPDPIDNSIIPHTFV
jgi:hypothetical protein